MHTVSPLPVSPARDESGLLVPLSAGTRVSSDGESWAHWAVYDRDIVAAASSEESGRFVRDDITGGRFWAAADLPLEEIEDLASTITGWRASYRGPGQSFQSDPDIRIGKFHVLITWGGGLDI